MTNKSIQRQRRARRGRAKVRSLGINRLTVYRSNKHIYAQIMDSKGSEILASASTNENEIKQGNNGNIDAASRVGKLIAERANTKGIKEVAFDRSGYKLSLKHISEPTRPY